jgi:hypothetical protein
MQVSYRRWQEYSHLQQASFGRLTGLFNTFCPPIIVVTCITPWVCDIAELNRPSTAVSRSQAGKKEIVEATVFMLKLNNERVFEKDGAENNLGG